VNLLFFRDLYKKNEDLPINPIIELVNSMKYGELELRDKFIEEYTHFIISIVSKCVGVYTNCEEREEFRVGLEAFKESIELYSINKNPSFLNYSERLIRKRIFEYIRKNKLKFDKYPFSYFKEEHNINFFDYQSDKKMNLIINNTESRKDIKDFEKILLEYNLSFEDFISKKFRNPKIKLMCVTLGIIISDNQSLYNRLTNEKTLPIDILIKYIKLSKRKIRVYEKLIIIVCLMMRSNLYTTKKYILSLVEEYARDGY